MRSGWGDRANSDGRVFRPESGHSSDNGRLDVNANGGPYIQNAPFNPTYYKFSISHGVLKLAVVKTVSPHITYKDAVSYAGPSSCSGVRALPGSQKTAQAIASCEADGATVSTAIAAFDAQNPGTVPTMACSYRAPMVGPISQTRLTTRSTTSSQSRMGC